MGNEVARIEATDEAQQTTALARREQVAGLIRPVAPPQEVLAAQEATRELIAMTLQDGRDYGTVPGTNKPSLLKPGGERVTAAMGCFPRYRIIEQEVDHDREIRYAKEKWVTGTKPDNWEQVKAAGLGRNRKFDSKWVWQDKLVEPGVSQGLYRYVIECEIVHRGSGVVIGQGIGSCSTMESKYIDRPRDLENTVIKMGEKRAFVGAVLNAFGLSDQFTQDVEDNPRAFGLEADAEGGDSNGSSSSPSRSSNGAQAGSSEPEAKCPKCSGAMWDNREGKTNAKAPDFKCKDKECAKNGGVYWPGEWPPAESASATDVTYLQEVMQALTNDSVKDRLSKSERAKANKAWTLTNADTIRVKGMPAERDVVLLTGELRAILTKHDPDSPLAFTPEDEQRTLDEARTTAAKAPSEAEQSAIARRVDEAFERVRAEVPPLGASSAQVASAVGVLAGRGPFEDEPWPDREPGTDDDMP